MEGPLPRREGIRVVRVEAEVRPSVLVVDPGRRIDHAGAEAHVVRLDQADRVPVPIDRREVDRPAAPRQRRGRRPGGAIGVHEPGELRGVRLGQERVDRDVDEVRIRQVEVAVGHRELRGFDPEMDPAGIVDAVRPERRGGGRLERLEHVQDLQRHDPRAVRRVGRDADAAIGRLDRLGPGRGVLAEVLDGDGRADRRQAARLALGDLPVVEVVEPDVRQSLERRRQGWQPHSLARPPGAAARAVDLLEARAVAERCADVRQHPLDGADEAIPGGEPLPRQFDRGSEDLGPRQPAVSPVGVAPGADGAGDRDRQRTAIGEGREPACPEGLGIGGGGRPAGAVQGGLPAVGLVPDQPERVTADPTAGRLDDAQHGVGRDRRVDGVPARAEDRQTGRGGEVMRRDDRSPGAADERHRDEGPVGHGRDCRCRAGTIPPCDPSPPSTSGRSPCASAPG